MKRKAADSSDSDVPPTPAADTDDKEEKENEKENDSETTENKSVWLMDTWKPEATKALGMLPMPTPDEVPDPGVDEVKSSVALFDVPWQDIVEKDVPMFFMLPTDVQGPPTMIGDKELALYRAEANKTLRHSGLMTRLAGPSIVEKQAAAEWLSMWSNALRVGKETHDSMMFRLGRLMATPAGTADIVWNAAVRLRNSLMRTYMECRLYSHLY